MITLSSPVKFYRDGYKGGMYGEYGGYDIILIKLTHPVDKNLAACLPGPRYETKKAGYKIAGYGRYRRVPCETTAMGPQVRLNH